MVEEKPKSRPTSINSSTNSSVEDNNLTQELESAQASLNRKVNECLIKQTDQDFEFRFVSRDDYDRGLLNVLAQLTIVGDVTREDF